MINAFAQSLVIHHIFTNRVERMDGGLGDRNTEKYIHIPKAVLCMKT